MRITILDTFTPPPVLPAHAPTNIRKTRMLLESSGHWSKSTVEKPVVVMMEDTWKALCRRVSPKAAPAAVPARIRFHTITAVAPRRIRT